MIVKTLICDIVNNEKKISYCVFEMSEFNVTNTKDGFSTINMRIETGSLKNQIIFPGIPMVVEEYVEYELYHEKSPANLAIIRIIGFRASESIDDEYQELFQSVTKYNKSFAYFDIIAKTLSDKDDKKMISENFVFNIDDDKRLNISINNKSDIYKQTEKETLSKCALIEYNPYVRDAQGNINRIYTTARILFYVYIENADLDVINKIILCAVSEFCGMTKNCKMSINQAVKVYDDDIDKRDCNETSEIKQSDIKGIINDIYEKDADILRRVSESIVPEDTHIKIKNIDNILKL